MARYFSGITVNENKYKISIIDNNLNIIFLDNLELDKLTDLLRRKSVTVLSVDAPVVVYSKYAGRTDIPEQSVIKIKKRSFENELISKNLLSYQDRYNISRNKLECFTRLYDTLCKLGFKVKKSPEGEKSIIESYPDNAFSVMGLSCNVKSPLDEILRKKIEFLKYKGIRVKDYLKRNKKDTDIEINTLCQAYVAYLYFSGECTTMGSDDEGLLVIPTKNIPRMQKPLAESPKDIRPAVVQNRVQDSKPNFNTSKPENSGQPGRLKGGVVTAEYCGAQYLYTNTDGIIRINELRPIKSYRPFTEIYEMRSIRQVQVIIGTTDGLRKVKANLIPNLENSNSFKAADDEDKRKLDSFWGNHGDKRGYLIKFNKVEVVKA